MANKMNKRIEMFKDRCIPKDQQFGGLYTFTEQELENYTRAVLLDVLSHVHWYNIDTYDIDRLDSMKAIHFYVRSDYGIPEWLKGEIHGSL